eukprot:scaffold18839_cov61-Cyclotella_meneghiniana.AAC.2
MMLLHRQSSSLREARDNNNADQHHLLTIGTDDDVMVNVQNEFALLPSNSDDSSGCCSTNDYKLTVDMNSLWMYHFPSLHHHRRIIEAVAMVEIEKKKLWPKILQRIY